MGITNYVFDDQNNSIKSLIYKDNYTLEKIISIKQRPSNPEIKTITFFDENGIFYRIEYYFHCCAVKNQDRYANRIKKKDSIVTN
jgi:hypothetical protein